MALANQAAAEAKKWRFLTTTGGVRAVVVPNAQGDGPIEFFGVDVADALSKCSSWDDHRTNNGKNANGVR